MNKYSSIDEELPSSLSFYKTKDKKKIKVCKCRLSEDEEKKFAQVNYMYLDEDPHEKKELKEYEITSIFDEDYFMNLKKHSTEVYEAFKKFFKKVEIKHSVEESDFNKIVDLVDFWRYTQGYKYGFVEHANIDISFFDRLLNMTKEEQDKFRVNLFFMKSNVGDKILVGYSAIAKDPAEFDNGIPCYSYLVRKAMLKNADFDFSFRNLTMFIDYTTFKQTFEDAKEKGFDKIVINWGSAKANKNMEFKGVGWYKVHKWPLYRLEPKWFLTVKNL